MTNDKKTVSAQDLSIRFVESFDEFCVGLIDLHKVRAILSETLECEPGSAEEILVTLDTAFREGLIKSSTYDLLTTDVDQATSADEPTEWSEETREEFADNRAFNGDESTADDTGYPVAPPDAEISTSPPEAVAIAAGTILKNRFELVAKIGAGSMADVYEAIDRRKQEAGSANPRLAIKVISKAFSAHPNALKTLQREALNSHGLHHPNIIRVFDFDWDDDLFFMTMERLEGRSLVEMLDEHRLQPLPFDQAGSIITGMCQGLKYAHEQGVIHADIKPGNIFVSTAGQTKILDFGIAHIANEDSNSPVSGAHTPRYASCEVLEGAEPTEQDDIFALACVAYRMLSGSRVFGSLTAFDAERKNIKPQRIETLNPQQWKALEQSLAFRRADRIASLDAFSAAFTDKPRREPDNQASDRALPGLPLQFGIPAIVVLLIAMTLALFWPDIERLLQPVAKTEIIAPVAMGPPKSDPPPPAEPVVFAVPQELPAVLTPEPTIVAAEPTIVAAEPPPVVEPQTPPKAEPEPVQTRFEELVILADDAMNDGRLVDPPNDNARLFILELAALAPEAPEVLPRQTRLAELMFLEAMIAITDEDFDTATRWIAETDALDVPEEMTQRIENELQKARNARSARQSESLGAIFASATPAAILADPVNTYKAMAAEPTPAIAITSDEPITSAGSLSLAMTLPDTVAPIAAEPAQVTNPNIALSALEFTRFVEAKFPRHLAKRRREPGWVDISFRVNTNGRTDDITILDAAPDGRFNKAAITAVSKWRFKPVYIDGVAAEKYSALKMRFEVE